MYCLSKNVLVSRSQVWEFRIGLALRRHISSVSKFFNTSRVTDNFINRSNVSSVRRLRRCGVATIEFALVAPFILFIIFGAVEFARMMMVRQSLTNAAREGCRHACLATTLSDESAIQLIRDRLEGVINGNVDPDIVDVSVTPSFSQRLESQTEVIASIDVKCADVSFLPPMFYRDATIRVETSMYRE